MNYVKTKLLKQIRSNMTSTSLVYSRWEWNGRDYTSEQLSDLKESKTVTTTKENRLNFVMTIIIPTTFTLVEIDFTLFYVCVIPFTYFITP